MDNEKDLIRIYLEGENVAISCDTKTEEEYIAAVNGLYSLFVKAPAILEGVMTLLSKKLREKMVIVSNNNSKIVS